MLQLRLSENNRYFQLFCQILKTNLSLHRTLSRHLNLSMLFKFISNKGWTYLAMSTFVPQPFKDFRLANQISD